MLFHLRGRDKSKTLSILAKAEFVIELLTVHDMNIADVFETLSRSVACNAC